MNPGPANLIISAVTDHAAEITNRQTGAARGFAPMGGNKGTT
jgi:hypothetical protein